MATQSSFQPEEPEFGLEQINQALSALQGKPSPYFHSTNMYQNKPIATYNTVANQDVEEKVQYEALKLEIKRIEEEAGAGQYPAQKGTYQVVQSAIHTQDPFVDEGHNDIADEPRYNNYATYPEYDFNGPGSHDYHPISILHQKSCSPTPENSFQHAGNDTMEFLEQERKEIGVYSQLQASSEIPDVTSTHHYGPAPVGPVVRRNKVKKRIALTNGHLVTDLDVPTTLKIPRQCGAEVMKTR